jgi:two-component system sensor histidine kinase DesK
VYFAAIFGLTVLGLTGSAYFVRLIGQLEAARVALAEHAVRAERRRLSGDLHDVLSQTLTAITLKGDLARRMVDRDRALALAELDAVVALATGQAGELKNDGANGHARSGTGLASLAERVAAQGGSAEAAGTARGRFVVRATLPEGVPA